MLRRSIFPSVLLLLLIAPRGFSQTLPTTVPAIEHKTYLLHVPGMGGLMNIDRSVTSGLLQGGIEADLQIYDWTGTDRGLASLANVRRHEEQSQVVANIIADRLRRQPDARVILTAHSAG